MRQASNGPAGKAPQAAQTPPLASWQANSRTASFRGVHNVKANNRTARRSRLLRRARLDRSTRELLNLLDQIDKAGAKFRSIGDPAWNTETPTGRLLSTLLAGIAEFERELIRERTGEGRKRAMAAV